MLWLASLTREQVLKIIRASILIYIFFIYLFTLTQQIHLLFVFKNWC